MMSQMSELCPTLCVVLCITRQYECILCSAIYHPFCSHRAVALSSLPTPVLLSHVSIAQLKPSAGSQNSTSQAAIPSPAPTAQPQPSASTQTNTHQPAVISRPPTAQPQPFAGPQGATSQAAGPPPPPLLPIAQLQPLPSTQSISGQVWQVTSGAVYVNSTTLVQSNFIVHRLLLS